jgi:proteasome assembly chaperone (PAC2) family protein
MSQLRILLSKNGRAEFLSLLKENNIEFKERRPAPGQIVAAGELIEILAPIAAIAASLAGVIVAWLNRPRAPSKGIAQTNDNRIVHLEGCSIEQITIIVREASSISMIQPTKDDPEA